MIKLIIKLTNRIWNREISRILCYAYEKNVIDTRALHELTSMFDPTQPKYCKVNKL